MSDRLLQESNITELKAASIVSFRYNLELTSKVSPQVTPQVGPQYSQIKY